jgi:biopolymer transport protein ExbD
MSMTAAAPTTRAADPEPMMDMNMTPLIDVMLVLIIMLIITIPRQNHAINHNMVSGPANAVKPEVTLVEVDFDGTILWNGNQVASRAALEQKMAAFAAVTTPKEMHVQPNKLAAYKIVAGVMAAAQKAGVNGIGLTGNEQWM